MTAEFAVVLTAVLAVLGLCVGSVGVIGEQVALTSLASSAARMLARGDDSGAVEAQILAAAPGTAVVPGADGAFLCVELRRPARVGAVELGAVQLSARGCALAADIVPEGGAADG